MAPTTESTSRSLTRASAFFSQNFYEKHDLYIQPSYAVSISYNDLEVFPRSLNLNAGAGEGIQASKPVTALYRSGAKHETGKFKLIIDQIPDAFNMARTYDKASYVVTTFAHVGSMIPKFRIDMDFVSEAPLEQVPRPINKNETVNMAHSTAAIEFSNGHGPSSLSSPAPLPVLSGSPSVPFRFSLAPRPSFTTASPVPAPSSIGIVIVPYTEAATVQPLNPSSDVNPGKPRRPSLLPLGTMRRRSYNSTTSSHRKPAKSTTGKDELAAQPKSGARTSPRNVTKSSSVHIGLPLGSMHKRASNTTLPTSTISISDYRVAIEEKADLKYQTLVAWGIVGTVVAILLAIFGLWVWRYKTRRDFRTAIQREKAKQQTKVLAEAGWWQCSDAGAVRNSPSTVRTLFSKEQARPETQASFATAGVQPALDRSHWTQDGRPF